MVKFFKIFSSKKKNPKKVEDKPIEVEEAPAEEANRPDPKPEEPEPEETTYKGYTYSNYQGPYTQIFNTPNQWKQCIDIFNNMDEDGDETIDDNEMWQAVMKVGKIRQIECGRKKFSMRSFNSIFNEFQEFIKTNGMKFTTFLDICQNMCVAVESWPPKFEDYEYYVEDENMFRAYFTFFQEMDSDGDNKVSEKELKHLLMKYFNSVEDQIHAITAAEEFFSTRLELGAIFATYLHKMYGFDLIDENVILKWYKAPPQGDMFDIDNYQQLRENPTLGKFVTWLQEAEEEESDSEEDEDDSD